MMLGFGQVKFLNNMHERLPSTQPTSVYPNFTEKFLEAMYF